MGTKQSEKAPRTVGLQSEAGKARKREIWDYWRSRGKQKQLEERVEEIRPNFNRNTTPAITIWETVHEEFLLTERAKQSLVGDTPRLDDSEIYAEFDRAARGRTSTAVEDAEWVKNHLLIPLSEIDPSTIPSPSTVVMLEWGRKDKSNFCEKMFPKQNNRDSESQNGRGADSAKSILQTIAECERLGKDSAYTSGTEGLSPQSEVPQEDNRTGVQQQ